MCFSAIASFASALVLAPIGIYSANQVGNVNTRYLAFATIPLIFAFQQFFEGMVWLSLEHQLIVSAASWSFIYLYFAYAFWPFYIPYCLYKLELNEAKKKLLLIFTIAGLAFGLICYLPILFGFVDLSVSIEDGSILYETYTSSLVNKICSLIYLAFITVPALFSSTRDAKYFSILVFIAFVVSYYYYVFAFTSVWCFFSAIISLHIIYIVKQVNRRNQHH